MPPHTPSFRRRLALFLHSVRFRLLLWGTLLLTLVLIFFSTIVYQGQANYEMTVRSGGIKSEASFIVEMYRQMYFQADGQDTQSLSSIFPSLQSLTQDKPLIPENEVLLVLDQAGNKIDQLGSLSEEDIAQLSQFDLRKQQGGDLIGFMSIIDSPVRPEPTEYVFVRTYGQLLPSDQFIVVVLGTPFDPEGQLPQLTGSLILASLIVVGVSLLGGYWLTGRLMQPVQTITRTAQEINANDLTRRLNLRRQDELGALADTFDRMLDRLEDAFERQRQFTADASHELRTPLTIINLEVNRVLEDPATAPELQKSLGVIRDENERVTHIVNNLLVLARADSGDAHLKQEVVDLRELTLEAVERLIAFSQRQAVEIATGEMPPLMVRGDRFYLSQLVTNLVENAIKYGAGEERKVWVETGCETNGAGRWARLRVEDHGPGIAAEHLPHIFDRFYRVDPVRSEVDANDEEPSTPSDGHGLGLSIAQWVARAHGGTVRVISQVGKGTLFEVRLPVVAGDSGETGTS